MYLTLAMIIHDMMVDRIMSNRGFDVHEFSRDHTPWESDVQEANNLYAQAIVHSYVWFLQGVPEIRIRPQD